MKTLHWQKVEKGYFHGDPPRPCYIEKNPAISGTPLWPKDRLCHPENIHLHVKAAQLALAKKGGHLFTGHVVLNQDREVDCENLRIQTTPKRLKTTFVSGFLMPTTSILGSQLGFHFLHGEPPLLKDVVRDLKGTYLLTNLGYFLTPGLIHTEEEGGLSYAHNVRHPSDEHLSPSDNGYLGGFFIRTADGFVGYPPHFGTAGVGITKDGKPILIDNISLKGGTVYFGNKKLNWEQGDVNPTDLSTKPIAIFTPSFSNSSTRKAIKNNTWKDYRCSIGEGRINIVVCNIGQGLYPAPKIAYIQKGRILQPGASIVFSLKKGFFKKIFPDGFETLLNNPTAVRFQFEPWFDRKVWNNVSCFYEGLLSLPLQGDVDFGWYNHPHACLTQETFIPNHYRREPRAVLVKTPHCFGAFVFSGRYEYSLGISFKELVPILNKAIQKIAPQEMVEKIINLDGGSGVKLCLIENGEVKPLNWVAPGTRNRIGDPNGNTYSCMLLKIGA